MKTLVSIAVVVSLAACTTSAQLSDGGKLLCANTGDCIHADFYAACFQSGAVIPIQLDGGMLPPAPISAPAPDGGQLVPAHPISLLFTGTDTLWLLDTLGNQIDLLDVAVWPPSVTGSIATGATPNQLVACDGMVLSINSSDNTVQGINPTTLKTVNEVNVGTGENPYLGTCDGEHTFYVSNSVGGDVQSVDLTNFSVTGKFTIPTEDIVADPDGGTVVANPQGIAFYPSDAGGTVFVTVSSLNSSYNPTGPGSVVATDNLLLTSLARIVNDQGCENPAFLVPTLDGTRILESCGGSYAVDAGSNEIARINPVDLSSAASITVPFANPTLMAVLKNGLVAVADSATPRVAVFNPTDGTIQGIYSPCPVEDGGHSHASELVTGLTAVP